MHRSRVERGSVGSSGGKHGGLSGQSRGTLGGRFIDRARRHLKIQDGTYLDLAESLLELGDDVLDGCLDGGLGLVRVLGCVLGREEGRWGKGELDHDSASAGPCPKLAADSPTCLELEGGGGGGVVL